MKKADALPLKANATPTIEEPLKVQMGREQ